ARGWLGGEGFAPFAPSTPPTQPPWGGVASGAAPRYTPARGGPAMSISPLTSPPAEAAPDLPAVPEGQEAAPQPEQAVPAGPWRVIKGTVIFLIVACQLLFLLVRNPLDHWKNEISAWLEQKDWWELSSSAILPSDEVTEHSECWEQWKDTFDFADRVTLRFANISGNEQGWLMFSPPMARRSPFLGVRFEFENSPPVTVESDTHPNPA